MSIDSCLQETTEVYSPSDVSYVFKSGKILINTSSLTVIISMAL